LRRATRNESIKKYIYIVLYIYLLYIEIIDKTLKKSEMNQEIYISILY